MFDWEEVERTFKNYLNYGQVAGPVMMYVMIAPVVSLIVASWVLFFIFTIVLFLQLFIGWRVWRSGLERESHQRVMAFFMFFNFGLHAVMPLFFFTFGTIYFYISLGIYLLLLFFLFTKTKVIAEAIHDPADSWIGKGFLIATVVIAFIAIPGQYRPSEGIIMQLMDNKVKAIYLPTAMYLLGLLLTFLVPVFFYPAQFEVGAADDHPKGRKKLSRAERKALKARKANKFSETDVHKG
ncbi:hypothetical protein A8F94_14945 [Bacillus sp. FJAT-27225]|uniref:hypothetical protein n=1 Tax=Bacillus sp. FJAT-27225 TaxID=1743144 RepID=UPI00080C26EC|nr:hypothetical protein [Bacillus sp. FJAT-27225]OCA84031.1 hypothetical protein A8F94_14945 [Bacillus sp. FJAT-27225]